MSEELFENYYEKENEINREKVIFGKPQLGFKK